MVAFVRAMLPALGSHCAPRYVALALAAVFYVALALAAVFKDIPPWEPPPAAEKYTQHRGVAMGKSCGSFL